MILRLAARQRRRLHWRHFLPLAFALLTMLVCAAGMAENVWPWFARLVGDPPDHVTARTEVWGAIYVAAAAVASLAAARFHLGLALVRFPLVLALATVGVVLFLLLWLGGRFVAAAGDSTSGGSASGDGERESDEPPRPPPPRNLAAAVLEPDDAEHALGGPVEAPMTTGSWVSRAASLCRYRTRGSSAFLTLVVHNRIPKRIRSRLWRTGEPVGVGDEAVANEHGVFATGGEWSVALTAWQRNREPVDRGRLVDVAERVLGRLPQGYEVDAYERRLFAGWRGRLNALFALLGLPTLPIRSQLELLSA